MKLVVQHTNIPIPKVFDFEASADQPFGYPSVFMKGLGGGTVGNRVARSIPHQYHAKAAKQLANVFTGTPESNNQPYWTPLVWKKC